MLPDPEEPFAEGHQSRERDWTFTPTFARIDADCYPDLLFVADFNRWQAFLNNSEGTFRNVTDTGVMIDNHGMGSAVADFDADGDLDWFVSSVTPLATPACDSPRYRCHSHPLALVLISH